MKRIACCVLIATALSLHYVARLSAIQGGLVEATTLVLAKERLKPLQGATVQVCKEGGEIIFSDDSKADGTVRCPGLRAKEPYSFRAAKAGYDRVSLTAPPEAAIKLELTKKYGP